MKKNIIMMSIIVVCITSLLLVIYNVNKNTYYISDVTEIKDENLDISMSQIVENEETVITETPTSGLWRIETEGEGCTSEKVTISWNSNAHKLKVRVKQSPIKCKITFVEVKADIQLISMYVNGKGLTNGSTLPEGNYKLYDYTCTDINGTSLPNTIVEWNNDTKEIIIKPLDKQTICQLYFGEIKNYSYTGSAQTFTAPEDGWYRIELWGAEGTNYWPTNPNIAGKGGYTSGIVELSDGESLQVNVGEKKVQFSGGGATDVRFGGTYLKNRIMVAGGAGGAGYTSQDGGHGGNLIGQTNGTTLAGKGGNQNSGGAGGTGTTTNGTVGTFGVGNLTQGVAAGGGGYGWSGGGSGGYTSGVNHGAGGGGSSYISGYAGVNSVNSSGTHTAQTNSTANGTNNKYFIAGEMQQGVNTGNGKAKITYEGTSKPTRINTTANTGLNNVRYVKNCSNGSTSNFNNYWSEIQAIKDGSNVGLGKGYVIINATNGDNIVPTDSSAVTNGNLIDLVRGKTAYTGNQCIVVDLESEYDLDEIMVLHSPNTERYYENKTYVAGTNGLYREVINITENDNIAITRMNAYEDIPTGYVQDGLQVWYDGIANYPLASTSLHSTTATTWRNLAIRNTYDGTLNGSPTWGVNYLQFDGIDDWVAIAQLNYANPTIEVVYQIDGLVDGQTYTTLIGNPNSGGYYLEIAQTVKLLYSVFGINGVLKTSPKIDVNFKKTALTASYNGNAISQYVGGIKIGVNSVSGAITGPTNNTIFVIGGNPDGSTVSTGGFFKGKIYSVRIYNRALTDEEVKWNYEVDKKRFGLE